MKLITDKNKQGLTSKEFREYLLQPIPKTEFTTAEVDEISNQLKEGLEKYPGLGLAANQIGIKKRACIISVDDDTIVLINPIITKRSDEGFLFYEGCLSIPKTLDTPIQTIRSTKVTVQTDNLGELTFEINKEGDKGEISKETLQTVIVQHEIDHLDGITVKDRVYSTTIRKNTKYGRNDKIIMKSPTGEFVEVKYKKANDYFLQGYEIV
jgi:peptide deformylase